MNAEYKGGQIGAFKRIDHVEIMPKDIEELISFYANVLGSKGLAITRGPLTIGKTKRAEIKDPSGISIELSQW